MNKRISFFLLIIFSALVRHSVAQTGTASNQVNPQPYFGFEGDSVPSMVLAGVVSTGSMETNGTFSPDGQEFFYATEFLHVGSTIIYMRLQDGKWSQPEIATFSGKYRDIDPIFSPDGKRLYFTSRRPLHDSLADRQDANIWYVERSNNGYSEPVQLGLEVNTDQNQYYNSVSGHQTIFFHAHNETTNSNDIFKASYKDGKYSVEPLDSVINSSHSEADPFISQNEDFIIFASNRPGGLGGTDLYISYAIGNSWTIPQNLNVPINSIANDYAPAINGNMMTFTSGRFIEPWSEKHKENFQALIGKIHGPDNGLNNILWVNTDFIERLRALSAAREN